MKQLIENNTNKENKHNLKLRKDHYYLRSSCDVEKILYFIEKFDDNLSLKCLDISLTHSFQEKLIEKILFKSIKILAIHGIGHGQDPKAMRVLIDYLSLDVIFDKKLFVAVYNVRFWDCKNKSMFDQLCQTIYQLFIKQIPIDIFIIFREFDILDKLDWTQLCFETDEFLSIL